MDAPPPLHSELIYFPNQQFSPRFGDKFFTFEIPTVLEKHSSNVCFLCQRNHASYLVTFKRGRKIWTLTKRYSDFLMLDNALRSWSPSFRPKIGLPPKVAWFFVVTDSSKVLLLKERREALAAWLDQALLHIQEQSLMQLGSNPIFDFMALSM